MKNLLRIICPLYEQENLMYYTAGPSIQATLISKALSDKGWEGWKAEKEGLINSIMGGTEQIKHWDGS